MHHSKFPHSRAPVSKFLSREKQQWQVAKLQLEHECAQSLLLVLLNNVVRESIKNAVEGIKADLELPQAFAMKLLTRSVAAVRR
jgi:hypothetical protein